ncbi:MAG: TolB family protein [Candidatus Limnocylindrales bacterium]
MNQVLYRLTALVASLILAGSIAPDAAAAAVPIGTHDGPDGLQSQYTCSAWGWAVDADHPGAVVTVRVLVDGTELRRGPADDYRGDLITAGVSPTGKASFAFSLWGSVSRDTWHTITVEALDIDAANSWSPIDATPKRISCHEYDMFDYQLFVKNLTTGEVRQLTNTTNRGDWNPAWSPNGARVAHDVVLADPSAIHGVRSYIGITVLAGGVTRSIKGTAGGNDPAWSPDGRWLAFDRVTAGDRSIYSITPSGGTRRLIRRNAASADISPSGRRIVYLEPSSSRIMAVDVKGLHPVVVARLRRAVDPHAAWYDVNPAWSPDGRWIAYSDGGQIWKVRVGSTGTPLARPVRLTSGKAVAVQPTWTPDGAWVVYQAAYVGDTQIWKVKAGGGIPVMVTEGPHLAGFGDATGIMSPVDETLVFSSIAPVTPS